MGGAVFLTGFPGFIATRLLRRLAVDFTSFFLLVQPALRDLAEQEISDIAQRSKRDVHDFHIVEGDVTLPMLGLSDMELANVRSATTIVFHLAAAYDLAISREIAVRVNLEGTRNVNEFARSLPLLEHYHYISTCYVAGKRKGLIRETELRHDAGFRNHYEETKYLAELEVEAWKRELPITIHRPAVVCGDSKTGETIKYDGVYYLIHYLLKLPRVLSLLNIGNDEVALNLVPVDFVVESLAALATDRQALGKTLQLADLRPLTTRQLFNAIAVSICGRSATVTVPPRLVEFTLMLPPAPGITGLPHSAVPYFFLKQSYDSSQAQELLNAHQISCPRFESYVANIVAYAARHPRL
jgi:thioester reductase-like protein